MAKHNNLLMGIMVMSVILISAMTPEEKKNVAARKADEIVKKTIQKQMTDFEKALLLHEYITSRVRYGKYQGETSAYTALIYDQADCVGFARGLLALFTAAGLSNEVVVRKKGHLWNRVMINGEFYNIDATWSAVKSGWNRYSWFLLSDEQNRAPEHTLDSGEKVRDCPGPFAWKEEYYTHKEWLFNPERLRVMGTVLLPAGRKAPPGGLELTMNGSRVVVSSGMDRAFFIASVPRLSEKDRTLQCRVKTDGTYCRESFYNGKDLGIRSRDLWQFEHGQKDITGLILTLPESRLYCRGKIELPAGKQAPAGGLYVSMELYGFDDNNKRFTYYDWVQIPEGKRDAEFQIDIDPADAGRSLTLYAYSGGLEKNGYEKVVYYSRGGGTALKKNADTVRLNAGPLEGLRIKAIQKK